MTMRYVPAADPDRYYRRGEIHPDVWAVLERGRAKRGFPVYRDIIDNAIYLQEHRSVLTARNYLRYILLGEMTYASVFGAQAKEYDDQLRHYRQTEKLEQQMAKMEAQMREMQQMLFNMARILNRQSGLTTSRRKTV